MPWSERPGKGNCQTFLLGLFSHMRNQRKKFSLLPTKLRDNARGHENFLDNQRLWLARTVHHILMK